MCRSWCGCQRWIRLKSRSGGAAQCSENLDPRVGTRVRIAYHPRDTHRLPAPTDALVTRNIGNCSPRWRQHHDTSARRSSGGENVHHHAPTTSARAPPVGPKWDSAFGGERANRSGQSSLDIELKAVIPARPVLLRVSLLEFPSSSQRHVFCSRPLARHLAQSGRSQPELIHESSLAREHSRLVPTHC